MKEATLQKAEAPRTTLSPDIVEYFGSDMVRAVLNILPKEMTEIDIKSFFIQAKQARLDPLQRQIYAVPRWNKKDGRNIYSAQVSIDGFRVIAERSGKYRGQTVPMWCGPNGEWKDVWTDVECPPFAARVGVLRSDFQEPIIAVALWNSYVQLYNDKPTSVWAKMPDLMLSKCAEALALRKAFPNEMSGFYTTEEMASSDNE